MTDAMPARMRAALARRAAKAPEVYEVDGCCCGGKPCGNGTPVVVTRYPSVPADVDPTVWKQQPSAAPQFDGAFGNRAPSSEPFTYAGPQLGAFAFPLGGFGAGHLVLRGDGTLQKWCVRNQTRKESLPLDCMPACFFGVSAGDGAAQQAFVLASPETYSADRCGLPSNKPAHVSPSSVDRLKSLPGVKSLSVVGKYPIADVSYDIPGFPLAVSLKALTPMVRGSGIRTPASPSLLSF